ncbi:hypothetical protein [Paraburkholderia largidicola]|uniref:Type IV pilus biogenesis protein PilP n=1 Tax=Paraburkholderia largidicola TaxID=3014751 RepID=A0A7I8C5I3_9BURK|nr:hypothetical protein [Paraburkholderia sp. PGU16]BCF95130.1 hypothetical protein PPGU16_81970 [Paraburkholderia sp. PGU16]
MFSINRLMALTCAVALTGVAHAQAKPAGASHVQPVSAHVPTADFDVGMSPRSTAVASAVVAASAVTPAASVPAPAAPPSRLSIDEIDEKIRAQVSRQLSGDGDAAKSIGLNTPAPQAAPAPVVVIKPPAPQPVRARTEAVKFVGAFNDATGSSVLYEFRGAFYPAHVGEKLLNGWRVSKISGFLVTVTDGEGKKPRTWTEPIAGGVATADPQDNNAPARTLNDLSGGLPPPLPAPLTPTGG